jgi:hypothetical protein
MCVHPPLLETYALGEACISKRLRKLVDLSQVFLFQYRQECVCVSCLKARRVFVRQHVSVSETKREDVCARAGM